MTGRLGRSFFFAVLLVGIALLFWTVRLFLVPVLLGGVLVVLTFPVTRPIGRLFRRRGLVAIACTVLVFAGLVVPLGGVVYLVIEQIIALLPEAQALLHRVQQSETGWPPLIARVLPGSVLQKAPGPREAIALLSGQIGPYLAQYAGALATHVPVLISLVFIDGFLLFSATYYFFLDGRTLLDHLVHLLPMPAGYVRELFAEFRNMTFAIFYGTGVVAAVQAVALFIAFVITGVPGALVWSALIVVMAFVPLVGNAIVWVPAGILLLFVGPLWKGIFILAWGTVAVTTIDNVLRPHLVKGRVKVHPLIVFLSLFGGIFSFGPIGFIAGPIIGAMAMALVRIWDRDFMTPHRRGP